MSPVRACKLACTLGAMPSATQPAPAAKPGTASMHATRQLRLRLLQQLWTQARQEPAAILQPLLLQIEQLVRLESPSTDKAACDSAIDLLATWAGAMPALRATRRHRHKHYGDSLELRFGPPPRRPDKSLLLLGHLDTVWPLGTLAHMPYKVTRQRLSGPGVLDMKSGVCMALAAIDLLSRHNVLQRPVTLLLHCDEEVGSYASRSVTESVAQGCAAVYVLEPAQGPQAAYKTARKGVARYRLDVAGVAAHSGVDFASGHSAVVELAQQITAIAALTDLKRGLTVNPGVIGGGTLNNVIAEQAWVEIDIRIARIADAARIDRQLKRLSPRDPACRLHWTGELNRPPMERTRAIASLFHKAHKHAAQMGFTLQEAATGGGSDGNFTAAVGVPTLDGMGAAGAGAHAAHEHVLRDSLLPRTVLLASMLLI
jgi:glutamate carboxypeptidase